VTRASARYLPPETVERIAALELRARGVVEGPLAGLHRSRARGQSVEFLQHREYVRGDDPRRVDWKVWGRQGRLYVKEYEEETHLRLTLAVDGSGSMHYPSDGSRNGGKFDHAATLAASLAWLALERGDAVGCAVFDDRLRAAAPARTRRSHLDAVLEALATAQPAGRPTAFRPVLHALAETLPPRGLVVIVSDLLGDRAGLLPGLRELRTRGHDLALLHVLHDDELDFPFTGPTRFEGLETAAHVACNPRAFRAGYLEALRAFLAEIRRGAAALGCDYELVRTSAPPAAALVRFLSRRASRAT
jgi:uncharacterized protein (DUF58 family)